MLKQNMVTFYLLAILMWIREVESGYAATWIADPYKYQKYGWATITSSYYGSSAKSTTVTFDQAYTNGGASTIRCYLAVRSFQTDTPINNYGLLQLKGSTYTNSSFAINTYPAANTVYYSLSVSYFCTYGGYKDWFFRQNYNILDYTDVNTGLRSAPAYTGIHQMNITKEANTAVCDLKNITTPLEQWKAVFFLTSFTVNTSSTSNMKRSYTFCSTTTLCIKFVKPQNLTFLTYTMGIMIINNGTKGTFGYVQWTGQISSTPTTSGTYYFKPPYYIAYYFFGFSDFDTNDFSTVLDCQIEYNIVGSMYNLTLAKQSPFYNSKKTPKVTLSYFFMMNSFCQSSPYLLYDVMKDDCNDICPDYTISIPIYYRCMPCYPGCKTCSAMYLYDYSLDKSYSNCLSCNAADGRVLNGTRCDCANNTVFEDGHTNPCRSCGSVVPGTLTCTFALNTTLGRAYYQTLFASSNWTTTVYPLFTSLSCSAGYLLKNKLCQTCYNAIPYCTNCASNVTCLACDSTKNATLFTNAQCYLCNLTNCIKCGQDNFCYQCATGYVVNATTGECYLQPCNVTCSCGGYILPKVNGICTTQCGDGIKAGSQTCDDGNLVERDGCSATCTIEGCNVTCTCSGYVLPVVSGLCSSLCGDGFKVLTEDCDDGNILNHDGCSSLCTTQTCSQNCSCQGWVFPVVNDACSTLCGDGLKAGPQQCDDHNTVSGDGCSSLCIKQNCSLICTCEGYALPIVNGTCSTVCGDGILLLDEQCDDGNVIDYDGCSSQCVKEYCNKTCGCEGWVLPRVNGWCSTLCGDGIKVGLEQCDDGNVVSLDGCSSICQVEPCNVSCLCDGYMMPRVAGKCTTICGDGFKAGDQQCDDNNTISRDGCSSTCIAQKCNQTCNCAGYLLPVINGQCSSLCGDGFKVLAEQCDDGNTADYDGCSSVCTTQGCNITCNCSGYALPRISGKCSGICGDNILVQAQQCEDGNLLDYDGCSSECKTQGCDKTCNCSGYYLPRVNGTCTPLCGDGFIVLNEECDDGNTDNYDGCSSLCKAQGCNITCNCLGYVLPRINGKCSGICGDGILVQTEQCDDGNLINNDGCSSICKTQPCDKTCSCAGYLLPLINGQCSSLCGDGFKVLTEQCDDGNTLNYDGCSSICKTEGCNITCNCSGYTFPRLNGKCSGICGDNIFVQSQQCEDGNLVNYDGCSSTCRKQGCQETCNCSGYYFPRLNGTCKTVCGDGFEAGDQNCDDGNVIPGDGCNELCKTEYKRVNGFFIYSQDKTFYPALVLFSMGFRVVGMEMLWVFQTFQLFLEAQDQQRMRFSGNIHGYSDSAGFPFKFQSSNGSIQQIKLFDKFNYMYLVIIGMFLLCAILQTLGQCLKGNSNQVANQSQISNLKGTQSTGLRSSKPQHIKQYKFEKQSDEGDFTVHYQKRSHPQTFDLLSQTRAISIQLNQPSQYKQRPHWMSRLSRVILRQLFFNLLMNVQSILVSQVIEIAVNNGIDGVLNFPTLIVIGSVEVFVVGMMAFCAVNKEYFGENQGKFKQGKCITYWIVTLFERVLIGVVIGIKVQNYLIVIAGLKLVVVLYYCIDRVYYQKLQNGRKIAVQVLHFLLITIYAVDCTYLAVSDARKALPSNMLQSIYTSILSLVVVITVAFLLRQFMNRCQADTRDSSQQNLLTENSENMAQRIFYSRKEMGESGGVMVNKGNRDNSNEINSRSIVEELSQKRGGKVLGFGHQGDNYESYYNKGKISSKPKTVKYNDIRQQHQLREDSDYVNSDIKRSQIKSKRSQLQLKRTQGVFDQYEREDQGAGKSRRGQESISRYRGAGQQQQSQYQQQQYQAQQRYNRTGRRLGRQKGRGYEQQGHKQNSYQQQYQSYQSKPEYIKQAQSSRQPPPYNPNIRHTYQQQPQPLSTKTKIKKFRSMHDSRMRHNTRQDQQYDDSVNYDAVSIRFR